MNFIKEGDEIVVSVMEHHSNFLPWKQVAEKCGAVLKQLTPDENGEITDKSLEVITDKTKLVAVTQVSNVLGRVNDIKHIAEFVRQQVQSMFPKLINCLILILDTVQDVRSVCIPVRQQLLNILHVKKHLNVRNIEIVDKAKLSYIPSGPNVKKNTLLATMVGFVLGCGYAVLKFLLDNRLRTKEEAVA